MNLNNNNNILFKAIKSFILEFVLYDTETIYNEENIVIGYQKYATVSGDDNFILMNLLFSDQPLIQSENYTRINKELQQYEQVYIFKTDYTFQLDFVGRDSYAVVNKFRNCANNGVACKWFLRKYNLTVEECKSVNNQTQPIDQKSYVTKFTVQLKLQGAEVVVMPLNKFKEVGVGIAPINY